MSRNSIVCRLFLDDIVGNLFYTLKKQNENITEVSFSLIHEYENIIAEEFEKRNINFTFVLSRDHTYDFLREKSDVYTLTADDEKIALVNDLPVDYFINNYHGYLSLDALKAIISDEVALKTLAAYNSEIEAKKKVLKRNN